MLSKLSIKSPLLRRTLVSRSFSADADRLLVVGSGVAGSAAALIAAEKYKMPTTLVFAGSLPTDCNSFWAQGGIIYRNYDPSSGDSSIALAKDIHRAGAGLCQDDAVIKVSVEGPERVKELLLDEKGIFAEVPFQRTEDGELGLCLEASHSAPRILYYADHTGKVITEHITQAAMNHPLITLQGDTIVTDLVIRDGMCVGVETLEGNELATRGVVLASGGLGGIYQHSTNPAGFNALGSSVAIAERAGVQTQDLEYVQFHPTALNMPNEAKFLLTEALRGEGAILRNSEGTAFAKSFHPDGELAPRDIVARGVFEESQRTNADVYLDITHRDRDWLHQRFPTIQNHLSQRGLDIALNRLPITPAAHYTCGGIATDLHGRTSLPGLYAAGEAARTGLHGGNRLASTSLLEGLVFGASVADYCGNEGRDLYDQAKILVETEQFSDKRRGSSSNASAIPAAEEVLRNLRSTMWDNVGVVRNTTGLLTAMDDLEDIRNVASDLFEKAPSKETAAVRDAATAGKAVAEAAFANNKSAGAHCRVEIEEEEEEELLVEGAR